MRCSLEDGNQKKRRRNQERRKRKRKIVYLNWGVMRGELWLSLILEKLSDFVHDEEDGGDCFLKNMVKNRKETSWE